MDRRRAVPSFWLLASSFWLVSAQSQTPVFRGSVDLVQLDVSVLDKNRQPVRGLTQADFTIFEDGKPQKVEAFSAVDLPDVVRPSTKWMNDVSPDVTTNQIDNHRIFVLVLDDGLMPMDAWTIDATRRSALSFIDRMGRDDLAAVVFTRDNRGAQDLTNDRVKLRRAVETLSHIGTIASPLPGAPHNPADDPPCQPYMTSMQVLQQAAQFLGAVPYRRKALLFLSAGMAVDIAARRVVGPLLPNEKADACGSGVVAVMQEAFREAQRANLNIYGLDPLGLRAGPGTGLGQPNGMAVEFLQTLSGNTGGHAIINTNEFESGLTQIFRENSSYYLLGYRPTNLKADGTIRRLDVKVNRPDVEVRSRKQYIAPAAAKPKAPPPPPATLAAIAAIVPKIDLPLRVAVAPFATADSNGVATIVLGLERPAQPERAVEEIELLVRAFTPEGDPRGAYEQTIALNIPPARRGETLSHYDLLAQLPLKPGRYLIRTSARSTTLDKLGSVYADVDVPDFAKEPLSISGVALTVTPGQPAAPVDALSQLIPIVPTAVRDFARYERVTAFLRVHEGGKDTVVPVTMTTRIVDAQDKAVFERTDVTAAEAFGDVRSADVRFMVPVSQLAPGDYLLTFEAAISKATARRDVRFHVK